MSWGKFLGAFFSEISRSRSSSSSSSHYWYGSRNSSDYPQPLRGNYLLDRQSKGFSIYCPHQKHTSLFSITPTIIGPLCDCAVNYSNYYKMHKTIPFTIVSAFRQIIFLNDRHNLLMKGLTLGLGCFAYSLMLTFMSSICWFWMFCLSYVPVIVFCLDINTILLWSFPLALVGGFISVHFFGLVDGIFDVEVVDWDVIHRDSNHFDSSKKYPN